MSKNFETIFLQPAPNLYNNVDKRKSLMKKLEL